MSKTKKGNATSTPPPKCPTHPSYQGIYMPRVPCSTCWLIYSSMRTARKKHEPAT